jgi:hypothetical protein
MIHNVDLVDPCWNLLGCGFHREQAFLSKYIYRIHFDIGSFINNTETLIELYRDYGLFGDEDLRIYACGKSMTKASNQEKTMNILILTFKLGSTSSILMKQKQELMRRDEKIHLFLKDLSRVYPGKGKEKSPLEWSSYLNE